jgi:large subunit ribosomal protein L25
MSEVTLTAETGRRTGTRPSRRLRAEGRVPGVIYGSGEPATSVSFKRSELRQALSTEAGWNALIRIEVDGESFLTLLREMQRHPVRRDVTHVDFLKVDETKPIEVAVPLHLVGEAKQVTVHGGMTEQRLTELHVRVRPDSIPNEIEVDISGMTLETFVHVGDLQLPEGVECLHDPEEAVVTAELTRAAITKDAGGDVGDGEEAAAEGDAEE